jgi:hypothetical protein
MEIRTPNLRFGLLVASVTLALATYGCGGTPDSTDYSGMTAGTTVNVTETSSSRLPSVVGTQTSTASTAAAPTTTNSTSVQGAASNVVVRENPMRRGGTATGGKTVATPGATAATSSDSPVIVSDVTISSWRGALNQVGSILVVNVARWVNQNPARDYPVQREHQWLKDGQDIPGAIGLSFTPGEAGTYQVREVAYFLDTSTGTFRRRAASTSLSRPIAVSGQKDPDLIFAQDLTYLGAFSLPNPPGASNAYQSFAYGAAALAFDPAGDNGRGSLFVTGNFSNAWIGEVSIPDSSTYARTGAAKLPVANLLSGSKLIDGLGGQLNTSGISGGVGNVVGGIAVDNGKLIISGYNNYSYNSASWYWTRSRNLQDPNVSGPFAVTDERVWDNPRAYAGYITPVPAELQGMLGGRFITGLVAASIVSTTADGPPIASFDPASFAGLDQASLRGKVTYATANTIRLDGGAAINGFYSGMYLGLGKRFSARIIKYDGASRIATVAGSFTNDGAPNSVPEIGDDWVVVPKANAVALAMYKTYEFANWNMPNLFPSIWDTSSDQLQAVVPASRKAVLMFATGGNGLFLYGGGSGSDVNAAEMVSGIKVYDPTDNSRGEHSYPYSIRCWAYDARELEKVKNGRLAPNQVKPYAVWNFDVPVNAGGRRKVSGAAFDPTSKRLYLSVLGPRGEPTIHAYQLN